ncbi:uncharacterized protein LOC110850007 isoform X2 [Folsomia candida]|uniref:uncharacterized protein LOC110850007 isoform X2 n=1 Tax=Folsomia candida TaxID=158441 RepID=UPI000B90999F|nr:uncharacterized protein LOC110850007 isoform X2 [Folsomia candida]
MEHFITFSTVFLLIFGLQYEAGSPNKATVTNGGIDYNERCTLKDKCKYTNTSCIDGICQCQPGHAIRLRGKQFLCAEIIQIHNIVTIEDHPWVIKNETCLKSSSVDKSCRNSSCNSGFLVDLIRKIDQDMRNMNNCTITEVSSIGSLDSSTNPPTWKTGIMAIVANNQTDLAMAPFGVKHLRVPELGKIMRFSAIFVHNTISATNFMFGFPLASEIIWQFDLMTYKLAKQRYLEQLLEKWFVNGTSSWSKKKQLTPYEPNRVCRTM